MRGPKPTPTPTGPIPTPTPGAIARHHSSRGHRSSRAHSHNYSHRSPVDRHEYGSSGQLGRRPVETFSMLSLGQHRKALRLAGRHPAAGYAKIAPAPRAREMTIFLMTHPPSCCGAPTLRIAECSQFESAPCSPRLSARNRQRANDSFTLSIAGCFRFFTLTQSGEAPRPVGPITGAWRPKLRPGRNLGSHGSGCTVRTQLYACGLDRAAARSYDSTGRPWIGSRRSLHGEFDIVLAGDLVPLTAYCMTDRVTLYYGGPRRE